MKLHCKDQNMKYLLISYGQTTCQMMKNNSKMLVQSFLTCLQKSLEGQYPIPSMLHLTSEQVAWAEMPVQKTVQVPSQCQSTGHMNGDPNYYMKAHKSALAGVLQKIVEQPMPECCQR